MSTIEEEYFKKWNRVREPNISISYFSYLVDEILVILMNKQRGIIVLSEND